MLLLWIGQSSSFRKRCIMKRNIFASLLAVAVISVSTVNSFFVAEAGVFRIKA